MSDCFRRPVYRFATDMPGGVQWLLKRNCSLAPMQLVVTYGLLCMVSLAVAGFFWWRGALFVLPFAALELVVVGVAFLLYARHASDHERILLDTLKLVVEWESAGKVQREEFLREWVRVEPKAEDGSLIEVKGGGRSVCVGRFIRSDLRPVLAREIRSAVRGA